MLCVVGRQGFISWKDRQAATAANAFHQALGGGCENALTAERSAARLCNVAKFKIAATQALAKDFVAAEELSCPFHRLYMKQIYQQAAILLSVMNAPENRSADELAKRLQY